MFPGHHLLRTVVVAGLATAVGLVLAPAASSLPAPDRAADRAIAVLVSRPASAASAALPQDFSRRFGYSPDVTDGLLGDPAGGCSSPVPLPVEFTAACRKHDLGYDLLRYAGRSGHALPREARRAVDERLGIELESSCSTRRHRVGHATCLAWADIAHGFVRVNSLRQGDAVPEPESPLTVAPAVAAGVACLGGAGLLLGSRRSRGSHRSGGSHRSRQERRSQSARPSRRSPRATLAIEGGAR
ncbi:hypothetical protein [Knoellia sp. LjRoot47]|uniref:hypothetical protein n=1 Tax=Knoellia sp. LjRoot47 TaxID=3342330 RepID=UPI003ECE4BD3